VVPGRYPGSNWLTGSQHQVNATLATRSFHADDSRRPFSFPVATRQAMWNWLDLERRHLEIPDVHLGVARAENANLTAVKLSVIRPFKHS